MALFATLALFALGVFIGFISIEGWGIDEPLQAMDEEWTIWSILMQNVGAALLLYAGVMTAGFVTGTMLPVLGLYIGATVNIAANQIGWTTLAGEVLWYVPFEFGGCLIAAAAGFYPIASACFARDSDSVWSRYKRSLAPSLALLGWGMGFIVVGAIIEFVVINFQ